MTWIRVDDQFADHPKVMALGRDRLSGLGLWHVAAAYCARYLTDGFVPESFIQAQAPKGLARRMIDVGLFTASDGGYRLHDWLDYNPPREKILAERKAAKERMNAARSHGVRQNESRTEPEHRQNLDQPRTHAPKPVPEVLTDVLTNGARESLEWIDPLTFYEERTAKRPSQRVKDWIEDLHSRFSRTQLINAMTVVPNPKEPNWLKHVDEYLEAR
jgi:hypothetical protein